MKNMKSSWSFIISSMKIGGGLGKLVFYDNESAK